MKKPNSAAYPPKSTRHFAERAPQATSDKTTPDELRLISKADVLRRIGVSYPTIWNWMRAGNFPRSRNLGGKSAWIESEVTAWIRNCPVNKLKGEGSPAKPGFAVSPHPRQKAEA